MYNDYWVILQAFKFFHLPVTSYCFKKIVKTNWFFIICWIPLLYYILKDNTYIYICISKVSVNLKKKKVFHYHHRFAVHKLPTYNVMNFFVCNLISAKTNSINFLVIKQISFLWKQFHFKKNFNSSENL